MVVYCFVPSMDEPLDTTAVLILAIFGLPLISVMLGLYVYALFTGMRSLALIPKWRNRSSQVYACLFLASSVLASIGMLVPAGVMIRLCFGVAVWFLHFQPSCLGFSSGLDAAWREAGMSQQQRAAYWLLRQFDR